MTSYIYLTDHEFLEKLDKQKHREIFARITALTFDEQPVEQIEGKVTTGSINIDGNSTVRRTCNLTVVAQDVNINDYYWGIKSKFTLEIGLRNTITKIYPEIIWFPEGTFVISTFNTSYATNNCTITISGKDKMCLLNGDMGGQLFASIDFGKFEEKVVEYEPLEIEDKYQYQSNTGYVRYAIIPKSGLSAGEEPYTEYELSNKEYNIAPELQLSSSKIDFYNEQYGEGQWSAQLDNPADKYIRYDNGDYTLNMYLAAVYGDYDLEEMAKKRDLKIKNYKLTKDQYKISTVRLRQLLQQEYFIITNTGMKSYIPLKDVDWAQEMYDKGKKGTNNSYTTLEEAAIMRDLKIAALLIHTEDIKNKDSFLKIATTEAIMEWLVENPEANSQEFSRLMTTWDDFNDWVRTEYEGTRTIGGNLNSYTEYGIREALANSEDNALYYFDTSLASPNALIDDIIYDGTAMKKVELNGQSFQAAQGSGRIPADDNLYFIKQKNDLQYFSKVETIENEDVPIWRIIREAVHMYGKEPYHNIIINDLEDYGLEQLTYKGENPLYVLRNTETGEFTSLILDGNTQVYYFDSDNDKWSNYPIPISSFRNALGGVLQKDLMTANYFDDTHEATKIKFPDKRPGAFVEYTVGVIEYGDDIGYRITDLVYAGDLISNIGDTLTSVLDKIKNMLGDFEYFYDVYGRFIFQRKRVFVNKSWNNIVNEEDETYVTAAELASPVIYNFENNELITAFNNTPVLNNLRNDYSVWGKRKGVGGIEVPIHVRYAIDTKPVYYKAFNGKIYTTDLAYASELLEEARATTEIEYYEKLRSFKLTYYTPYDLPGPTQQLDGSWTPGWWDIRDWARFYELLTGTFPKGTMKFYSHGDASGYQYCRYIDSLKSSNYNNRVVWLIDTWKSGARTIYNTGHGGGDPTSTWSGMCNYYESEYDENGVLRTVRSDKIPSRRYGVPYYGCSDIHTYPYFLDIIQKSEQGISNYTDYRVYFYNPDFPEASFKDLVERAIEEEFQEWLDKGIVNVVDWREIIYQMAKDYESHQGEDKFLATIRQNNPEYYPTGYTGYEQYYTDLTGFWRQLYDPYATPEVEWENGYYENEKIDVGLTKLIQYDPTDWSVEMYKDYFDNNTVKFKTDQTARNTQIEKYEMTISEYIVETSRLAEIIQSTWRIDGVIQNANQVDWSVQMMDAFKLGDKQNDTKTTYKEATLMRQLKIAYLAYKGQPYSSLTNEEIDKYLQATGQVQANWEDLYLYAAQNPTQAQQISSLDRMLKLAEAGKLYYLKNWQQQPHNKELYIYDKTLVDQPGTYNFINKIITNALPEVPANLRASDWYIPAHNTKFVNINIRSYDDIKNYFTTTDTISFTKKETMVHYIRFPANDYSVLMYTKAVANGNTTNSDYKNAMSERNRKINLLDYKPTDYIVTTTRLDEIMSQVFGPGKPGNSFDWSDEMFKIYKGQSHTTNCTYSEARYMRGIKLAYLSSIGRDVSVYYDNNAVDSAIIKLVEAGKESSAELTNFAAAAKAGKATKWNYNAYEELKRLRDKRKLYFYKNWQTNPTVELENDYYDKTDSIVNTLDYGTAQSTAEVQIDDFMAGINVGTFPSPWDSNQVKFYYVYLDSETYTTPITAETSYNGNLYYQKSDSVEEADYEKITSLSQEEYNKKIKEDNGEGKWYYKSHGSCYRKFYVTKWNDLRDRYTGGFNLFYIMNDPNVTPQDMPDFYLVQPSNMVPLFRLEHVDGATGALEDIWNNNEGGEYQIKNNMTFYYLDDNASNLYEYKQTWHDPKISSIKCAYYMVADEDTTYTNIDNWSSNALNASDNIKIYQSCLVDKNDDKKYWNLNVFTDPSALNFWLDFLDSGELAQFSVPQVGSRSKVVNDNDVSSIYFKEIPNIIIVPQTSSREEAENMRDKLTKQSGFVFLWIPTGMEALFSISYRGKNGKDAIDSLLYQQSYCIENITLTSVPIYYLEPNNRIFVYNPETSVEGEYIVSKITLPLAYNGTMSITASKAPERLY